MEITITFVVSSDGSEKSIEVRLDLLASILVRKYKIMPRMMHNAFSAKTLFVIFTVVFNRLSRMHYTCSHFLDARMINLVPESSELSASFPFFQKCLIICQVSLYLLVNSLWFFSPLRCSDLDAKVPAVIEDFRLHGNILLYFCSVLFILGQ